MKLPIHREQGATVFTLTGEMTQNDYLELPAFIHAFFLEKGERKLIFDCKNIEEFPSIAFGVFCTLSRDLHRLKGMLTLIGVKEAMLQIMKQIHFDQQVRVMPTLEAALQDGP